MLIELLANADYQRLIVGGGLALVALFIILKLIERVFDRLDKDGTSDQLNNNQFFNVISVLLVDFKSALDNNTKALNNNTETLKLFKEYIANGQERVDTRLRELTLKVESIRPISSEPAPPPVMTGEA